MSIVPRVDPASSPIALGPESFGTKKAAVERVRSILHAATPGRDIVGTDQSVILGLFVRHPRAIEKLSELVKVVVGDGGHGSRCFFLVSLDGSHCIDFSYRECITPSTARSDFSAACRRSVESVTESFREKNFVDGMKCPVTGEVLKRGEIDVDHVAPMTFARLVQGFIDHNGIDVTDVEYDHSGRGVAFKDFHLDFAWYLYHETFASLRLVTSYANRVLLREAS